MPRVLGVDPGSRITGFGIIDETSTGLRYVSSGSIRVNAADFPERLQQIFEGLSAIVAEHRPDEFAIEQVFIHKNADSALKLGQARGAAICAVFTHRIPVFEYAARQVKQALVGKGNAEKSQVQHMIRILLGLQGELQADAGDALAIALCHIHCRQTQRKLAAGRQSPAQS